MDQEVLLDHLKKANIRDHILFISDSRIAVELLLHADDQEIRSKLRAVFLDLRLPGFGGLEILRLIRSTPEIASLPVIVMTGLTEPKILEECRRLKATSYLPKPLIFGHSARRWPVFSTFLFLLCRSLSTADRTRSHEVPVIDSIATSYRADVIKVLADFFIKRDSNGR